MSQPHLQSKEMTITFVKSIPFPGRRYQVGEKLTGQIVKSWVRQPDLVEVCAFLTNKGDILMGLSYRSFSIDS